MFKTFTLKWWQTGLADNGHDFFGGYLFILIVVAVVSLAYVSYVWWKQ